MTNIYKHDYDNILSIVESLKSTKSSYEEKIIQIKNLINNISTSPLWIDMNIKTSFINCCNGYITLYEKVLTNMTGYIDYLEKKSENAYQLESAYSRR